MSKLAGCEFRNEASPTYLTSLDLDAIAICSTDAHVGSIRKSANFKSCGSRRDYAQHHTRSELRGTESRNCKARMLLGIRFMHSPWIRRGSAKLSVTGRRKRDDRWVVDSYVRDVDSRNINSAKLL